MATSIPRQRTASQLAEKPYSLASNNKCLASATLKADNTPAGQAEGRPYKCKTKSKPWDATLEMANRDANEQSVPGVRWRRKAACKKMFLTAPIDAAAVDATAKGLWSTVNLIDEGLVCDLDSEADQEGDVPGIVLSVGLPCSVGEFSCFVIPAETRRFLLRRSSTIAPRHATAACGTLTFWGWPRPLRLSRSRRAFARFVR